MSSVFEMAKSINIIKVYERYSGNPISNHRHLGNVSCPCHTDTTPSMKLYDKTNSFYCFSCKKAGSNIDLYMAITGVVDSMSAAKQLCDDFGLSYTIVQPNPEYYQYVEVYKWVSNFFQYLLHTSLCPDKEYFNKRGFKDLTKEYGLGYCPSIFIGKDNKVINFKEMLMHQFPNIKEEVLDSYRLYNDRGDCIMYGRYIFTIYDAKGNPVGFSGRSIDPDNPAKYYNTPETTFFKKGSLLYNFSEAKKYGQVYIVEGYCDALSLISLGIKNVVACMGTSFTTEHINMLKSKEIILSLDNDNAGKKQMENLIKSNKDTLFKVLLWQGAKDFNDLLINNVESLKEIFDNPKLVSGPEFIIKYYKETLDLSTLEDREKLWTVLASLIGANDKRYFIQYPINTLYTPVAYDYYWTIVKRIVKGKRGK